MISMFRAATIRKMLGEDPQLMAVASSPELQLELIAVHDIDKDRTGTLYCLDGIQVAMLGRDIYDRLKAEEVELIGGTEEHGEG